MKFKFIKIIAPKNSPNNHGIHIAESSNIKIIDSIIRRGDDCISIGPGSQNLQIACVFCDPDHGISIGSLGKSANEKDVVGLKVNNCTLSGTDNGLRIKTCDSHPCEGVELSNINLKYNGENKNAITMSTCINAHVISDGNAPPYLLPPTSLTIARLNHNRESITTTTPSQQPSHTHLLSSPFQVTQNQKP
ncbi:Exopolygalacturonase [Canna indica]|uniref:Exopolygalacturonase n=1 Tax=Canna indica TaxID=4628 RepID=A0AAQ3JZ63_9LILI|nr:Exopolygalacturonase [Canna indica]